MDKRKAPLETGDRIEPALLEEAPTEITDIVAELSAKAATLGTALHPGPRPISPTWCAS